MRSIIQFERRKPIIIQIMLVMIVIINSPNVLIGMSMIPLKDYKGKTQMVKIDKDILSLVLDKAKNNVKNNKLSFFMVMDADSGAGKTTALIQFGKYLDPSFCLDDIAWTFQQFKTKLLNAQSEKCIMFDEGMLFSSRGALSKINKELTLLMSQIRSRRLYILLAINSIFDLDRNLALFRLNVLVHLYQERGRSDGKRLFKVYGKTKLKHLFHDGRKYYSYGTTPHFRASPPEKYIFLFDEVEYERRKQEAIKYLAELDKQKELRDDKKQKKRITDLILVCQKLHSMKLKDIAEFLDVKPNTLSMMMQEPKDNGEYDKMLEKIKQFKDEKNT